MQYIIEVRDGKIHLELVSNAGSKVHSMMDIILPHECRLVSFSADYNWVATGISGNTHLEVEKE